MRSGPATILLEPSPVDVITGSKIPIIKKLNKRQVGEGIVFCSELLIIVDGFVPYHMPELLVCHQGSSCIFDLFDSSCDAIGGDARLITGLALIPCIFPVDKYRFTDSETETIW